MSLKNIVQASINDHLDNDIGFEIDVPKYDHGDYALNLAFKLAKQKKKSPKIIAEEITTQLNKNNELFRASSNGGFVNIRIEDAELFNYFVTFLNESPKLISKKNVILEYVSANPTGPLHIGHGRWAAIGDSLYRLLKSVNINVKNEFYINDAGNQIHVFNESIKAKINGTPIPENGYGGHYIEKIINQNKSGTNVDFVIDDQRQTLKKMNCTFDQWFKESSIQKSTILEIINKNYQEHVYKKDHAIWFRTTTFGDDKDRVIMKENGDLTYFAADIAYHLNKIDRGFNQIVNIWGADHHGYVKRIEACIKAKTNNVDLTVILGQLVHLYKNGEPVKMSKRTGELIELDEVIDEIGSDAARYFLLEKKPDIHLEFDLSIATKKNMDNPVYYIQYAHARICNIINKISDQKENNSLELNDMDRQLMLIGSRYYDVLYEAAKTYEPYKLAQYLYNLAKLFHSFYQKNHVIYDEHIHIKRLDIIKNIKKIIVHGFEILGISTPEKM